MNKKTFIIILILLPVFFCKSQEISFLKDDQLSGESNGFYFQKVIQKENNYYIAMAQIYEVMSTFWYQPAIFEYSPYGKFIYEVSINSGSITEYPQDFFYDDFICMKNGDLYIQGVSEYEFDYGTNYNLLIDSLGKIKWKISTNSNHFLGNMAFTDDSSFVYNEYFNNMNTNDISSYIVKVDYKGNVKWRDSFTTMKDPLYERIISLSVKTNNYLCISEINDTLLKLKSFSKDGNVQWSKTMYDILDSNDILQLKMKYLSNISTNDGYYILTGNNSLLKVVYLLNNGNIKKTYTLNGYSNTGTLYKTNDGFILDYTIRKGIYKFDSNFNKQWDYRTNDSADYYNMLINIDQAGNINYLTLPYTNFYGNEISNFKFYKLNSKGKINLKKKYHIPNYGADSFRIWTAIATNDKGYLILGTYGFIEDSYQYGFLLKLDSNGNINDTNVIINDVTSLPLQFSSQKNDLIIYPNPLTNISNFILPENNGSKYQFILYSSTGKKIRQEVFYTSTFQFNRKDLPGGMYIYEIIGEKEVFKGKLIINP